MALETEQVRVIKGVMADARHCAGALGIGLTEYISTAIQEKTERDFPEVAKIAAKKAKKHKEPPPSE